MNKLKKKFYNFVKYEGMTAAIAAMVIVGVFVCQNAVGEQDITVIDWTMFTSIVIALLLNSFSKICQAVLLNRLEDSAKLTSDYKKLVSKYSDDVIVYDNCSASQENLQKLRKKHDLKIQIPVICEYKLENCMIEIQDSTVRYQLPDTIGSHFDELFAAHSTSQVYNQLNIRVDDWNCKNGKFMIKSSRTTYFDSLVTNRAMDFQCGNGLTVRELFEFGPYLHPLKESCLSNHIGFNGFIESSDGYIVFVKRGGKLSIGKRTYGNSIGASLKAKYALNSAGEFTEAGLINGILHEIKDELKIPKEALETFSFTEHLIAAYRDLVEGGKPQLLFFIRSCWTKNRITHNFISVKRNLDKSKKNRLLEDGKKLLWIPTKELVQIGILPDMIIYHGKSYRMMPSASASVVMLLEYLKKE